MPFELNGKPHYLAYNSSTGRVTINRIRPGARPDPATKLPMDVIHIENFGGLDDLHALYARWQAALSGIQGNHR